MKQLLILLAFTVAFTAQAQFTTAVGTNEKYIEIKATDTMMVNPDFIVLNVSIENDYDDDYYDSVTEDAYEDYSDKKKGKEEIKKQNKVETPSPEKQVEDIFKKYNLTFAYHEKGNSKDIFSKGLDLYEEAYKVTVSNVSQVEEIKKELLAINNVSVHVAESKILNKEKYELQLVDKVMKRAEREAMAIAKAMNVTLDKPINVSNQSVNDMYSSMFNNSESMGGMGALFSMMGNMFKGASDQSTQVAVSKTLIVRYSIK